MRKPHAPFQHLLRNRMRSEPYPIRTISELYAVRTISDPNHTRSEQYAVRTISDPNHMRSEPLDHIWLQPPKRRDVKARHRSAGK
jgi:hypothetical protein